MMQRQLVDGFVHAGLRKRMVDALRADHGITDEKVLAAMQKIPRHFLLDSAFDRVAYEVDRAFPIPAGQTISRPSTVALQSQLLEIKPMEKVLEIGTGSTYQATVLAELGARVFTIERQKELYQHREASYPFKKDYPNLKFFFGDGFAGIPGFAPFDKIVVTAAAPHIPQKLMDQLKVGGKLVIPLNDEADDTRQIMLRLTKNADGTWQEERFQECSFVPMLEGKNY